MGTFTMLFRMAKGLYHAIFSFLLFFSDIGQKLPNITELVFLHRTQYDACFVSCLRDSEGTAPRSPLFICERMRTASLRETRSFSDDIARLVRVSGRSAGAYGALVASL